MWPYITPLPFPSAQVPCLLWGSGARTSLICPVRSSQCHWLRNESVNVHRMRRNHPSAYCSPKMFVFFSLRLTVPRTQCLELGGNWCIVNGATSKTVCIYSDYNSIMWSPQNKDKGNTQMEAGLLGDAKMIIFFLFHIW